ncbi:MAG TPA: redoxin domain-containing protein [Candidatus Methylomirabilis sp.]|nr:redoxin domain-containing protein [Candidatus Methylomirabilis sp.]
MTAPADRSPLKPGDPAPDFTLAAVGRDGTVSLDDYRGRSPVLLAMFRGLYCPFCRRAIAQLGVTTEKLKAAGVETLAIVATSPENARLYFKFRPTRAPLAADPELVTHRAFGLPRLPVTPELMAALQNTAINPSGELPEPLPPTAAMPALDKIDGFTPSEVDRQDAERQFPQIKGQFLVDRAGIVRWANIETAGEGVTGLGKFPTDEELLAAARALR